MNFEDSSLYLEVKNILYGAPNPVHHYWTATLHLKDEDLMAIKVVSADIKRDYEVNFADEVVISVMIPYGKYAKRVYPNRNNLEITITQKPMTELGSDEDAKQVPKVERYVAVMLTQGNPLIEGDDSNIASEDALDLSRIITVDFQLMPKSIDLMRMKSVGGSYRGVNTDETVKAILTRESQSINLPKELLPLGTTMVEANNKTKRDHIVIPHGTKLVNLPSYIQEKCGGIYSAGLGSYYQDKYWYLYPLYNTDRFDDSLDKVTIINVPGNKLPSVERSYRSDGSNTVILATGEAQFRDNSDQQQLAQGNGVRFADASKFLDGFVTTSGNKATVARGGNVNEVISVDRASGNNNVHVSENRISSNIYNEYSALAKREGSLINLLWENADPDLIYPGLPVRVLYLQDDVIHELRGVILKTQIFVHMKGQVMFSNTHYCNIGLSIFVNRKKIKI